MRPAPDVNLRRRALLVASLTAGGGLLVGALPLPAAGAPDRKGALQPNAFVRVNRDNTVTVILPYVEMGQGAYTSQMMVVAEELEVAPARVVLEAAPADEKLYGSPLFGGQITGGSGSLRGCWMTMRSASAAARMMLVGAAARQWGVDPSACECAEGVVHHRASGRSLPYGQLTEAAARLPVPAEPPLKQIGSYKLIGKPLKRVDGPDKVKGKARFGIDMRLPRMRYAVVAASPVFGGTLASVDDSAAMRVRGVRQVVKLDDAVAVVADHTWAAIKGMNALKVAWNEGPNAALGSADLTARADAALDAPGKVFTSQGNVQNAEAGAASRYEAVFRLPILAHAAIEPLSCTVHVQSASCEVWCGSQVVGRAQKAAAEACGLPLDKVKVHNQLLGGGFGRRLEVDYVAQAARIGKQVAGPVKVTWTRSEEFQHDYYRGQNHSRITVALDRENRPQSWRHRIVGPNIMSRWLPVYTKDGIDLDIVHGASGPYDIPNMLIDVNHHEAPKGMNAGNWRGVGPTRNVFIVESAIEELARRAKADPLAYRLAMMGKAPPRIRAVLEQAARDAGWGSPLPARSGRGIAVFDAFGSYLAMVAQVSVAPQGDIRVERVTCAVDCGLVINPDIVLAQLEGGVTFGLSSALYERITVKNGRVEQANFDTYPLLRMHEAPPITVRIMPSKEEPGGVGELGTAGAIAAVANAVSAATGVRAYSLPLDPALFKVAS
ncbi:aldehyde dehydrogenase [Massilia sp. KIM]|uniref:xanthine dehydrogenase family protein molybdopterin-binding subunit n=1 Tax=Massilia sp. KIM TaxID=1955422 RepID=UPI00098E9B24|nr:molybdopterin cofactor-binding domain-containing protein [Massilia sp. KIM]OON63263.1 aldehyde dehydrogenase [Massilia sp. KIM]